ncbi:hypothetical protein [Microbispora sp. H10830]|nr:hypothetical protein [Microbispora sp. H10830]
MGTEVSDEAHEHVRRLEVAMHDSGFVNGRQGGGDTDGETVEGVPPDGT